MPPTSLDPYAAFQKRPFPRKHSWVERLADVLGWNRFFLREGKRPHIRAESPVLLSPVDGKCVEIQTLRRSGFLRGKSELGRTEWYSFDEIVHDTDEPEAFNDGVCFNFYLSPFNLHYVLFPASAMVRDLVYHPAFCRPILFMKSGETQNERLVVHCVNEEQRPFILILIGSFLVGGIECVAEVGHFYECGELLGGFKLGSTVMMLFPKDAVQPLVEPGTRLLLNEPFARFQE